MHYKQHLPLIIACILPVVFILGVLFVTYPTRSVETAFNVVLARCPQQGGYWKPCAIHADAAYTVTQNTLVYTAVTPQKSGVANEKPEAFVEPELIIYNPETHMHEVISKEAALQLQFMGTDMAPDGTRFEYRYGRGGDFFPFVSSGRGSGWYITQNKRIERIDTDTLGLEPYAGTDRLQVLGWVAR